MPRQFMVRGATMPQSRSVFIQRLPALARHERHTRSRTLLAVKGGARCRTNRRRPAARPMNAPAAPIGRQNG
jgi:hypothetical protein